MKKYLKIYREFFKTCLSVSLGFRLDFILQTLMNLTFLVTSFLTAAFIFNHVESIGVWKREEFLCFLAFAFAVDESHYLLFSFNFWIFSNDVRRGDLDFHLLKPVHSLFLIFTRYQAIPGLVTAFVSYILLIYFGIKADMSWIQWVCLPVLLCLGLALWLGLEIFISLLNFFTVEGFGVNHIRLQFQHFGKWPDFIYQNPARRWLLPFLAVTSVPARFLMDISYWDGLFLMAVGTLFLWVVILWLWPKALCFYKSPSS